MNEETEAGSLGKDALELLEAVSSTAPSLLQSSELNAKVLVSYIAGTLEPSVSETVERAAVDDSGIRRRLVNLVQVIERFKQVPFHEVETESNAKPMDLFRKEWVRIVEVHVDQVTRCLRGIPPTRWVSLAQMAKSRHEGSVAAKTIWRALFVDPNESRSAAGLIRLGFGYRRSITAIEAAPFGLNDDGQWTNDASDFIKSVESIVTLAGDLNIDAALHKPLKPGSLFASFTLNGRTLALAEMEVRDESAHLRLESMGAFLKLAPGPLNPEAISLSLGSWPEKCEIAQIVVESHSGSQPQLGLPNVRNGVLEISGYFDEGEVGARWELSLAVSPNSWQVLGQFDINGVVERPQVIKARMPKTALDGPFGGALLLKRLG